MFRSLPLAATTAVQLPNVSSDEMPVLTNNLIPSCVPSSRMNGARDTLQMADIHTGPCMTDMINFHAVRYRPTKQRPSEAVYHNQPCWEIVEAEANPTVTVVIRVPAPHYAIACVRRIRPKTLRCMSLNHLLLHESPTWASHISGTLSALSRSSGSSRSRFKSCACSKRVISPQISS